MEKQGQSIAAVAVPAMPDDRDAEDARQEAEDWAVIERLQQRNADKDPDEVLTDATAAVDEARREIDEEERRAAARGR